MWQNLPLDFRTRYQMPDPDTICGYTLSDVRRELRDAIDRREWRAARRWTAELVATPAAVGSLWASYWLAWAAAQGAGSASPTLPILLKQSWVAIAQMATDHLSEDGWPGFRNDTAVRGLAAETTQRLLTQSRQTPVVWPTKEVTLYDVSVMRDSPVPAQADSAVVMRVWKRDEDSMELRLMAGRWLAALEAGDLRCALSAVAWSMLPHSHQGLSYPLKVAERGPAALTPKQRAAPLWFWLEIGRVYLLSKQDLHRGWPTFHSAVSEAFRLHFKRWTATDRMRVLLAWILQIRSSMQPQTEALWVAPPIHLTLSEIDLPYKEIAAELANPQSVITKPTPTTNQPKDEAKESKKAAAARIEAKMAEADAAILAAMGIADDDV